MVNVEVLSNINENTRNENENVGTAQIKNLLSFLINGRATKNMIKGIRKNITPPHADNPNAKNIAPKTNFIKEILPLLNFIPDVKRYNAINAKNSPNGSDLNHPIRPLVKIGTEIENINAANNPAEVPLITRTNPNTTNTVREPMINGKYIVKLYNDVSNPKILYNVAVVRCNVT
tara:strand:- start:1922 stop:2446 length:525 start_codon:yes stop_codon:yes gene_type:complete